MNDASHRIYTPRVLAIYDWWVLGVSNRWIWKCPTARLLAHYNQHVSANHLDVGVGTGYFLDRCRWPTEIPRITLLDANEHALCAAARRIARYQPTTVQGDLREPLVLPAGPYDSIGLNYVLHCLPGSMEEKANIIVNLAAHLAPGGTLFGATILGSGIEQGRAAQWLMRRYQSRGIFGNSDDDQTGLTTALQSQFQEVSTEMIGCVALFAAKSPLAPRK